MFELQLQPSTFKLADDAVTQECKKKDLDESFIGTISDYYRRERRMKPVKVPKIRHVPTSKLDAVAVPQAGESTLYPIVLS